MELNSLSNLDDCIENMRSEGLDDKTIALNLATASALVKTKKWNNFYLDMKKKQQVLKDV